MQFILMKMVISVDASYQRCIYILSPLAYRLYARTRSIFPFPITLKVEISLRQSNSNTAQTRSSTARPAAMSNSTILSLEQALSQLQSYTTPISDKENVKNNNDYEELKQRYLAARHEYLKHRIRELVALHLEEHSLEPPFVDENAPARLEQALEGVKERVNGVNLRYEGIMARMDHLQQNEKELKLLVGELKKNHASTSAADDNEDQEEDGLFTQEEDEDMEDSEHNKIDEDATVKLDNETTQLTAKRAEFMTKLRVLQSKTEQVNAQREEIRKKIQRLSSGSSDDVIIGDDSNEPLMSESSDSVERKIEKTRENISTMKEMAQWYETVRRTMESLGGIQVKNVARSPEQDSVVLQLTLLEKHTLQITLQPIGRRVKGGSTKKLRVTDAGIEGNDVIIGKNGAVRGKIPRFDDIVDASRSLPDVEDLRFVIRECLCRLRGAKLRLEQLVRLREKYLTQIEKDGAEVTCSLNDGVAVVLRLTPDCPWLPGSVYIEQIAGLGGWDQSTLNTLKDRVNSLRLSGAVEVMDALVKEIKRRSVAKPGTPLLTMKGRLLAE